MDWPWLPDEAVINPRLRSSGLMWARRFIPPRSLKEPRAWWFFVLETYLRTHEIT